MKNQVSFGGTSFLTVFGKITKTFLQKALTANPRNIGGARLNCRAMQLNVADMAKLHDIIETACDNNMSKSEWVDAIVEKW